MDRHTREWDRDFKRFIAHSNQRWTRRYPKFRSDYQGDKLVGYNLVKGFVKIPKRYLILRDISVLTEKILDSIVASSFVIKAVLGHQGNKVVCFQRTVVDGRKMYRDRMRSDVQFFDSVKAVEYCRTVMKARKGKGSCKIIIEEYIGDPDSGIPIDYKVYVCKGRARIINLYRRTAGGKYMACFDTKWNRIPLNEFYVHPEELGYIDDSQMSLPPIHIREELIRIAERLSREHRAKFCRYDFYYENDTIYFGEITPVCGGLHRHALTAKVLAILFSEPIRQKFIRRVNEFK